MIEEVGRKIRHGECGLSDDEILTLMHMALHEKWYLPRLEHEFNVSQRTLERWCKDGTLPPLHEDELHRKFLYHDEVEEWRMKNKNGMSGRNHP